MNYNLLKGCHGKDQVPSEMLGEFPKGSLRVQLGDEFLYVKPLDTLVPFLLTGGLPYTVWHSESRTWRSLSDFDALDEKYVEAVEAIMREEDQTTKGSV